jgi:transposase
MNTASNLYSTNCIGDLIEAFLPASLKLRVDHVTVAADELTLVLASAQTQVRCPVCGQPTTRVHSRYMRSLQDLPWGQRRVRLHVQVHRFFCANPVCARRIFTEPLADLAEPYARRTTRLREALLRMGWALGGEAGARQCAAQARPLCAATMLALLRRWGAVDKPTPRVLGVDDWSFQAHTAGTLLVDLERHQPIAVLLGSDDQVLADWLRSHPGVEIISRDRGASYLKGASKGAPQAKHVLDRWHLLKNLGEVLQKILALHVDVLQQAAGEAQPTEPRREPSAQAVEAVSAEEASSPSSLPAPPPSTRPARQPPRRKPARVSKQRRWQLEMYEQVHRLAAEGHSQGEIAKQLQLHPHTVRKYVHMEHFVDQRHNPHGSSVEPYRAYLEERWSQGCTMAKTLWQEIRAQGFTGSYKSVCLFTRQWPRPQASTSVSTTSTGAVQQARTPWQTKWLLLRAPDELSVRDASYCQAIYDLSPALATLASLARSFVQMVRERKEDQLDAWLKQASISPLPDLRRFVQGLSREYAAVRAALSEPWSTGQVEGQITRLKYLKRQMYGRASIDLLRLRVLHAA